jgi:WD40 repeat protein
MTTHNGRFACVIIFGLYLSCGRSAGDELRTQSGAPFRSSNPASERKDSKADSERPQFSFRVVQRPNKLPKGFTPGPKSSPDGKISLKAEGATAQLYEVATGKPIGQPLRHPPLRGEMTIRAWAFSPDGKVVAIGAGRGPPDDSAGGVSVWEVATGKLLATATEGRNIMGLVYAVAFSPDGKTVIVDCAPISGK